MYDALSPKGMKDILKRDCGKKYNSLLSSLTYIHGRESIIFKSKFVNEYFDGYTLLKCVHSKRLKITHFELISLISERKAPSRTRVDFCQLKLSSLHAYKI